MLAALAVTVGIVAFQGAMRPEIARDGIVNSASGIPQSLGGAISPGSLFTIRGVRLGGVVTVGSRRLRAVSVSPREISVRMPLATTPGTVKLTVENEVGPSEPVEVPVMRGAVGLYSQNRLGWGPGVILDSARVMNSPEHSAHAGDVVAISIEGGERRMGATVFVGTRQAAIVSSSAARIHFRIPAGAPVGCYVPLYASAGAWVSNTVTISIADRGDLCTPEGYWPLSGRVERRIAVIVASHSPNVDEVAGQFVEKEPGAAPGPLFLAPPAGTCTQYFFEGTPSEFLSQAAPFARGIDAGKALEAIDGNTRKFVPQFGKPGVYHGALPRSFSAVPLRVRVPGGNGVSAFSVALAAQAPPSWTNSGQLRETGRSSGARVIWTPVEGTLLVVAAASNRESGWSVVCLCAANARDGEFTIPALLLRHFPAGPGELRLVLQGAPATISHVSGLDAVLSASIYEQSVRTSFR